jgi:hypothetical protein
MFTLHAKKYYINKNYIFPCPVTFAAFEAPTAIGAGE